MTIRSCIGLVLFLALSGCGQADPRERAAIPFCKAMCAAQEIYRRHSASSDIERRYASTFDGPSGLLALDDLRSMRENAESVDGGTLKKFGYVYKILGGQGPSASGKKKSYIDESGRMRDGYAFMAYPSPYGGAVRRTFIISLSSTGTIFEADLGPNTESIAQQMTEFEPTPGTWSPTDD